MVITWWKRGKNGDQDVTPVSGMSVKAVTPYNRCWGSLLLTWSEHWESVGGKEGNWVWKCYTKTAHLRVHEKKEIWKKPQDAINEGDKEKYV